MISKEELIELKNMNVADTLISMGYRLKKISINTFCLEEHKSLQISPTKGWYWHSHAVGGNIIDFFMIYEGLTFIESIDRIRNNNKNAFNHKCHISDNKEEQIEFILPAKNYNNKKAIEYLINKRNINKMLAEKVLWKKMIYEDTRHNVIFLGFDENKIPRYATKRGIGEKKFAGDVPGSNKDYGFFYGNRESKILHVFESPIDVLSYISILLMENKSLIDIEKDAYLSLGGVSLRSIDKFLENNNAVELVYVRTDNDKAGRKAYENILQKYFNKVNVLPAFSMEKDYNDDLKKSYNDIMS